MPGGIYKDVSQEERRRLAEERYQQLISGLALDGGVSSDPPVELGDVLDEMLLHPEAAERAGDAAAVSPQEYGKTSPTLLDEEMYEDTEPLEGPLVPLDQREPADPNAPPPMDPIDVELLQKAPPIPERLHVDAAMRQQLPPPPPSMAARFAENHAAVAATLPPPPPPAAQTAASVTPPVSEGKQADLYGLDGEKGFTRERAILAAREAYGKETQRRDPLVQFDQANAARKRVMAPDGQQLAPVYTEGMSPEALDAVTQRGLVPDAHKRANLVSTGVDPGAAPNPYGKTESRWEDEFLQNHEALTDRQIRTRTALIGLFGGVLGGDMNMAKDYANREFKVRAGHDEGLAQARARDKGEQRIDQGLAEAIASTGNVSPEEAATLTYNSPLVAAYTNGMYSGGIATERLERLERQFQQGELGKTERERESNASQERQNALRVSGQLSAAGQLAAKRGQTVPSDGEQALGVQTNLQLSSTRLGEEAARRVAYEDDYSLVPEQDRERVRAIANQARQLAQTYKGLDDMSRARIDDPRGEIRQEQAIDATIKKAQQDRKFALGFQTNWEDSAAAFREAHAAWQSMSPAAQANFVQWGRQGFASEMISDFLTDPGDQEAFAKVQAVVNPLVKDRSGSAVTGSEWHRIGAELGLAGGDWRPLNSPGVVTNWLDFTGRALTRHRQQYESVMNGWKGGQ